MPFDRAAYAAERKAQKQATVDTVLAANPCQICGEADPLVLQFHHLVRATKVDNIARMVGLGRYTRAQLVAEISKCTVLCANDHLRVERNVWPD